MHKVASAGAALLAVLVLSAGANACAQNRPSVRAHPRSRRGSRLTGASARQRNWLRQSREPTGSLHIAVVPVRVLCGGGGLGAAVSCRSEGAPWELAASDRESLYFELGGILDSAYLKDWQRATLAKTWGASGPWWDSTSSLAQGTEDGLEADFAGVYEQCALGNWQPNQGVIVGLAPPVQQFGRSCQMIARWITSSEALSTAADAAQRVK